MLWSRLILQRFDVFFYLQLISFKAVAESFYFFCFLSLFLSYATC